MKKTAFIFVLATLLSACTKDLTSLNNDPKNPLEVTSASLFTQGQRQMCNVLTSSNVNINVFRLIEQQWQETTYTDESNYDFVTRQIPDEFWREFYALSLVNLERAKKVVPTDVTDPKVQKNDIAIADILEVYDYYYLLTTYGNIPYSQALDINNVFPKFDDAKTVYNDLLARLDADIAALDPSVGSYENGADVFYNGDVVSWQKFANTFKLKMGITIADSDPTKAQTVITSAVAGPGGLFTSNEDNATFKYVASPPNTNPVWVDLVQSGRQDFVAATTVLSYMHADTTSTGAQDPLRDPRLPYYFTTNSDGYYFGGDVGESASPFNAYSKPSGPALDKSSIGKVTNADFPALMLDYAETEFNLAEAAARGWIGGSAATHYNNGILASMDYWGVAQADATAYTLLPNVLYTGGALPVQLQQIALQKYLALYNRGVDAWIETRRLDYPVLTPGPDANSDFPVRFTYPINEQNINEDNYNQASTAIGGDDLTTKLFFDVN